MGNTRDFKENSEESLAMELLKDFKKQNKRQFVIILVLLLMFTCLLGYTIWLLNDIGTQVLENRFNCSQNACATQKEILQNRYDNALQTQTLSSQMAQCCCDLRAEGLANTQKVIDLIQQDKIDQLRDQVYTTNLALNNANLTNQIVNSIIPRPAPAYPSCSPFVPSTYGYGCNSCGCGSATII